MMHQVMTPVPIKEYHHYIHPIVQGNNNLCSQQNILIPPLKIKQPIETISNTFSSIPVVTSNNNENLLLNPINLNSCHNLFTALTKMQITPNIVCEQPNSIIPSVSNNQEEEEIMDAKIENDAQKNDMKKRNRIAAQKWRNKKNCYLAELESSNDELLHQAFSLCYQMKALKAENKILEDELQFFQSFISKIMTVKPKE